MKLEQNSVRAFPKGWLFLFSGFLLFLTALVHGTGFSAGGSNVQYLPVVQRPFGEYWSYRYEVEGAYYRPWAILELADSTYLVVGKYYAIGVAEAAWAMKIDRNGIVIWNKTFDQVGSLSYTIVEALPTADGGAIVVGSREYQVDGAPAGEGWLSKLNSDGSVAWQKMYGDGDTFFQSAVQADNGDIVVVGSSQFPNYVIQALVLRLTDDGNIIWRYNYGGELSEFVNSVAQTDDGGFIVAGENETDAQTSVYDSWVLKLNGNGSIVWQKIYDYNGSETTRVIIQTDDGGYALVGINDDAVAETFFLKLTADGSITWQKRIPDLNVVSLEQSADGYYTLTANSAADHQNRILKLDAAGSVIWSRGYSENVVGTTLVKELTSGHYLIAALMFDESGDRVMQLAKVNALGELPGCNDIVPMSLSVVDTTFSALNTNHAQEYVSVIVQNGAADVENSSAGVSIVCSP